METIVTPHSGSVSSAFPSPPGAASSVLVVEDHIDLAETLSMFLDSRGYRTRVAGGGEEALALAREAPPEVAVLDLGLPGISGYELARELVKVLPAPPALVALSGSDDRDTRRAVRESGFGDHLVKPVELERLVEAVARVRAGAGR